MAKKDKQRSTKHTHKTKDRVTLIPLKTGGELRCSGMVSCSCSTSGSRRVNLVTNPVIRAVYEHISSHICEGSCGERMLDRGWPEMTGRGPVRKYVLHTPGFSVRFCLSSSTKCCLGVFSTTSASYSLLRTSPYHYLSLSHHFHIIHHYTS
jgi:hypothetical protein